MYQKTLSYYVAMLYRSFSAFTGERLQAVGLNFGLVFFIVYIGKKPNCTPSELTKELALDWGHSQRCVNRLVEDGFITKEKSGRHYLLNLTERGQEAFEAAHRVFFDWDSTFMTNLNAKEKEQLLTLQQLLSCKAVNCAETMFPRISVAHLWAGIITRPDCVPSKASHVRLAKDESLRKKQWNAQRHLVLSLLQTKHTFSRLQDRLFLL